ncbi:MULTISPECIES: hypothetical protein [unclassified Neisseria]|uniref:hypothetical protein n=1 Tax=unclassified Neisseria TaxID=2623750 RepID=UPI0010727A1A|nr:MULTISPECIES: hypothetical protein [unclassified Neisseria]MBF0804978.1 hypothetical protein [Neisseria sp. 19428wB4_WF04]TFU39298.1 hypothetical protein E4T99_11830 [Neisseria sp. WF04]
MKEIIMTELNKIFGGAWALNGGGGGNPGQSIGGNIGISYTPDAGGLGFSCSHNFAHINGIGTFHQPASAMLTFTKKW